MANAIKKIMGQEYNPELWEGFTKEAMSEWGVYYGAPDDGRYVRRSWDAKGIQKRLGNHNNLLYRNEHNFTLSKFADGNPIPFYRIAIFENDKPQETRDIVEAAETIVINLMSAYQGDPVLLRMLQEEGVPVLRDNKGLNETAGMEKSVDHAGCSKGARIGGSNGGKKCGGVIA